MRLNLLNGVDSYKHKTQREHAIALHELYSLNDVNVPSVEDIVVKRISIFKHFNECLKGIEDFEVNEDELNDYIELCGLLNIDYDSIKPMW